MERSARPGHTRRLLVRGVGLLLLCGSALARALTVQLLGAGPGSEAFVAALRAELGEGHQVVTAPGPADLVVALHEGVVAEARAQPQPQPRLFLLPTAGLELQSGETALYWAPPLADQLRLARAIMPGLRRVALLVGHDDLPRAQALRQSAATERVEVIVRETTPALLARQVGEVAATADLLLAPVDPQLYSRDNLKPVLLSAYRQNRVLIGPTPAWVKAGSLASLYATPETLAADVAEAVRAWQQNRQWPGPTIAGHFAVLTNPQVARALGLRLPEADSLTRQLQSGRGKPWR